MAEEKKYEYTGTVTISTEEYTDIIKDKFEAEKQCSTANSDYWKEYRRANELEGKLKDLESKYNILHDFVNSSDDLKSRFKLFKIEQMENGEK